MKKLLLLLLICPFILGSCSSDDEDDAINLNGTTWECLEVIEDMDMEYKSVFKFQESTFTYSGYESIGGRKNEFSGSGTYTYKHPNITLTEKGENTSGIVSKDKITIEGFVYTKK